MSSQLTLATELNSDIDSNTDDDPFVRMDLVNRVRAQIADGTYDQEARIDALLDSLAEDLNFRHSA